MILGFEILTTTLYKQCGNSCLPDKCQHNDLGCLNINAIRNINSADFQTATNSSVTRLISLPAPCQTRSVICMPCFYAKVNKSSRKGLKKKNWTYGTNNRFTHIREETVPLAKVKFTCMLGLVVVVLVKNASELIRRAFVILPPW